jgi:hypothetical protein
MLEKIRLIAIRQFGVYEVLGMGSSERISLKAFAKAFGQDAVIQKFEEWTVRNKGETFDGHPVRAFLKTCLFRGCTLTAEEPCEMSEPFTPEQRRQGLIDALIEVSLLALALPEIDGGLSLQNIPDEAWERWKLEANENRGERWQVPDELLPAFSTAVFGLSRLGTGRIRSAADAFAVVADLLDAINRKACSRDRARLRAQLGDSLVQRLYRQKDNPRS